MLDLKTAFSSGGLVLLSWLRNITGGMWLNEWWQKALMLTVVQKTPFSHGSRYFNTN